MIKTICKEIIERADYLENKKIETVYFGGGTPSLLNELELGLILETIHTKFSVSKFCEITLEANPDDLNIENLVIFKNVGINRLSIGIQSFYEPHLQYMNRAHNAIEADSCVKLAQDKGFENISIDLIYGIPFQNHTVWEADLSKAIALNVPHVSSYCLTIEPKTTFGNWLKTNKIKPIDEDFANQQFDILISTLTSTGFEHYEISNFAKHGCYSKHNSNYWSGQHYLGIGPSAHSYNSVSRQNNISNNAQYIKALQSNLSITEIEFLTPENKINEYILTSLRTQWGCSFDQLQSNSGVNIWDNSGKIIRNFQKKNWVTFENNTLKLTQSGKHFADLIASELFV